MENQIQQKFFFETVAWKDLVNLCHIFYKIKLKNLSQKCNTVKSQTVTCSASNRKKVFMKWFCTTKSIFAIVAWSTVPDCTKAIYIKVF